MNHLDPIPTAPTPVGPYSIGVEAQGLLFLSGQVGIDPASGTLVKGSLEEEVGQVLRNIEAVLTHRGLSWQQVVMTSIFLTDMGFWPIINELYGRQVAGGKPPARQTVAVSALPLGARVEISVIAESKPCAD